MVRTMMIATRRVTTVLLVVMSSSVICAQADLLSQVDTFDTGIMGWTSSANPAYVATGVSEGYLRLSRAVGSEFHLGASNKIQWTGDFLASGITAIDMDLNKLAGPHAINVRVLIFGNGGVWGSKTVTPVAAGWNHYSFGLTSAELQLVSLDVSRPFQGGGTGVLNDTLSSVNTFLIRHDYATPTPPGNHPEHIAATLGIDNIDAIPEPGTLAYLLVSGIGVFLARKSRLGNERIIPGNPALDQFN